MHIRSIKIGYNKGYMKDKYFISIGRSSMDQKTITDISLYVRRIESELERAEADITYWKNACTALAMDLALRDGTTVDRVINGMDNKTIHMIIEQYDSQSKKEAEEWKEIAKGLYDYYYLGEGHSRAVREYERKAHG